MYLLRELSGNEVKVFYIACHNSKEGGFKPGKRMESYKLPLPTILKALDKFCRKGIMTEICGVYSFVPPFDKYAGYIALFPIQERSEEVKENSSEIHATITEIVKHYGILQGVTMEQMNIWFSRSIKRMYNHAYDLYRYTNDLEKSKRILERAAAHFGARGLSWSLQGAVLDRIFMFLEGIDQPVDGIYTVDTSVKKVICAYKIVRGLKYDDLKWDQRHLEKAKPLAEAILDRFEGDWKVAVAYIENESASLKEKKLDFNLGTLADRVMEYVPK